MDGVLRYYYCWSNPKGHYEIFDRKTSLVINDSIKEYDKVKLEVDNLNKAENPNRPDAIEVSSALYNTKNRTSIDVGVEIPTVHK